MFFALLSSLFLIGVACALPSRVDVAPRAVCTPKAGGSSSVDDTPAIQAAFTSCGNAGTIVLPQGTTYYLNSALSFVGCNNCDFQIEGTMRFTNSTSYWNGKKAMILVDSITRAKIRSLTGEGVMDGNGQASWDLFSSDSSYKRPTLLYIQGSKQITVTGFAQKNPPNVFVSIESGSSNVVVSNLDMTAVSTSSNPAHNTDAFDVGSSTYITISDNTVVNDDDCVAFKAGANYVTVSNMTCTGSHGMSVGSLGESSADLVQNIYVTGAKMINSAKAAGIKTYPHTAGGSNSATVRNVTMTDFTVQNCDYAIQLQPCYNSQASQCKGEETAQLSDIVFSGFSGTSSKTYQPYTSNITCPDSGSCGVIISGYSVKPPSGTGKVFCADAPSNLGVTCSS